MADAPNTASSLSGIFKEVYGESGPKDLVPEGTKIQKLIPFVSKQKELGKSYNQPVLLAYEQGFTFSAADNDAFTLNDSVGSVVKNATVTASQVLLRSQIGYELAARAAKGRNSFVDSMGLVVESMQKSMRKRLEIQYLYGQSGLATVASVSTNVLTLSTAEFAPGIWSGMEGAQLDVYNGSTLRDSCKVVAVDLDARTITVDAAPSGTAANDTLYYKGAYGNEMAGIHKVLTNSGSLFGISASTYTLWKASSTPAGSVALTQAIVGKAVAAAVAKGMDDDLTLLVNPKTWGNLLNDQAALRRHVDKSSKVGFENGAKSIEFYSQNGKISIEPSIYIKEGHAMGITPDVWKRIGATDVTFKTPGNGDQIFLHLSTKAGYELRCYADVAIFSEAPGKNMIVTGIVNS